MCPCTVSNLDTCTFPQVSQGPLYLYLRGCYYICPAIACVASDATPHRLPLFLTTRQYPSSPHFVPQEFLICTNAFVVSMCFHNKIKCEKNKKYTIIKRQVSYFPVVYSAFGAEPHDEHLQWLLSETHGRQLRGCGA